MVHEIIAIHNVLAEKPGSLSGFAAECSCGSLIESSLVTIARQWGRDHCNYYNAKEGQHV